MTVPYCTVHSYHGNSTKKKCDILSQIDIYPTNYIKLFIDHYNIIFLLK